MKVKPDSIQRWCALTLEQYKDDMNRRTAAGIQGAHVIPNAMGPKEVRPRPLAYSLLTYRYAFVGQDKCSRECVGFGGEGSRQC